MFRLLILYISTLFANPVVIDISNPKFRKLIAAKPQFFTLDRSVELKNWSKEGPMELTKLLSFSGLFNVVAPSAYSDLRKKMAANPDNFKTNSTQFLSKAGLSGFDVKAWRAIGIETVTIGQLSKEASGAVLTIRTIDINRGELLLGKRYSQIQPKDFKPVIRRYADLILKAYTGKPGIFSSKIAFIGRKKKGGAKQLFVCDFDGSNLKQLTKGSTPNLSPSWSRDGKYVTFTSYKSGNPGLYRYSLNSGKIRKLTNYKGLNSGANYSHNNNLIAFTGAPNRNADIYTISPNGGKRSMLIKGSYLDVEPAFSPNGKWIAFVSGRYGNPHIFLANLIWSGPNRVRVIGDKRLTYAGWYNATPAWSNDSKKIAFAGYDRDIDRFDIFMMNPDGKNLERLTLKVGDNESPSWAPNSQMLVFHSNRVGNLNRKGLSQLYLMNRDGSSQRKLYTGLYSAETPEWSPQIQ